MLVLTRKVGQSIYLNNQVLFTVIKTTNSQSDVHIQCDPSIKISRLELFSPEKQAEILELFAQFRRDR